jgi:CRP-like cAMP-binding protein
MTLNTDEIWQSFKTTLLSHCSFSAPAWDLLSGISEIRQVQKGELILNETKVCRSIDFVYQGAFRAYHLNDGIETTTAFATEGNFVTDMRSLSTASPSLVNIHALESSLTVRLYKDKMTDLYNQSAEIQALGRSILEAMVVAENNWKEMYILYDPQKRYEFLLNKAPHFLTRIPLQYIASFLGIRRETLSRIRSRQA